MTLEKIRDIENRRADQTLYKRGDEYIVVSTVGELADNLSDNPLGQIVGPIAAEFGYETSGEETMAFPANEDGEVTDWGEIAVANGENSRARVLAELSS